MVSISYLKCFAYSNYKESPIYVSIISAFFVEMQDGSKNNFLICSEVTIKFTPPYLIWIPRCSRLSLIYFLKRFCLTNWFVLVGSPSTVEYCIYDLFVYLYWLAYLLFCQYPIVLITKRSLEKEIRVWILQLYSSIRKHFFLFCVICL